jgi:hypothetical protein
MSPLVAVSPNSGRYINVLPVPDKTSSHAWLIKTSALPIEVLNLNMPSAAGTGRWAVVPVGKVSAVEVPRKDVFCNIAILSNL